MNANANFINDARQIVRDYFTQCEHYEKIIAQAAAGRRSGAYSEDYERATRIDCENAMIGLRSTAGERLAELKDEFTEDLTKRTAPNGAELDSADFRLLRSGLSMSLEEFQALCQRNAGNETVLRAAGEYAGAHNWGPYFMQYYRAPAERLAAFEHVLKTANAALNTSRQYSSALDSRHWECVTADDAKVIGSSADYYRGNSSSRNTKWSAEDSTLNIF